MRISLKMVLQRVGLGAQSARELLTHPSRDWALLLVGFLVLTTAFVAWGGYLFWSIQSGEVYKAMVAPVDRMQAINQTELNDTLLIFERKEGDYTTLRAQAPATLDPSR